MSRSDLQAASVPLAVIDIKSPLNYCSICKIEYCEEIRDHAKSEPHVASLKRRLVSLDILERRPEEHQQEHYNVSKPSRQRNPQQRDLAGPGNESDFEESNCKPGDCLFCKKSWPTLNHNINHMHKAHGLFIPDRDRLMVDLETFIRYLHLIIFRHRECLWCHCQKRSVEAVQQHMIGKGHCNFDIYAEESEFGEFYVNTDQDDQDLHEKGDKTACEDGNVISTALITQVDTTTARLASGKLFSHRPSGLASRSRRQWYTGVAQSHSKPPQLLSKEPSVQNNDQEEEVTSTFMSKRQAALTLQLESLSINDRAALAHLPAAEQRSLISTQNKQLTKAKEADKRLRTRLEIMGNSVKRSNFRSDVVAHDRRKNWNA